MNLKGRIPIISSLLYPIHVLVYDSSINKFIPDRARRKKQDDIWVFEFAKRGNSLPITAFEKRTRGKMLVFSPDGINYQPMAINIDKKNVYIPEFDVEAWHLQQIKRVEKKYKKESDARAEAFKFIGIGLAAAMILIGLGYLISTIPMSAPNCNCAINGIDLLKCEMMLHNQTLANTTGGFI